jgi:hypothetical protein
MQGGIINRHHLRNWIGILPGWSWLEENEHNLDGWQPTIELSRPGIKYHITLKPDAKGIVSGILKEK